MPRKTKMNMITTPELLAAVNPENTTLLRDFMDYLRSVKRSEMTIRGYENDIHIAFVWNLRYNNNKFFVDWTKRNVVAYQNWLLNENENSPARVRRLKSSLSSLANYVSNILDEEFPNYRNIINKIENPALQSVREKTVWSDSELDDLLQKLDDKGQYEKACFVALAMYSGRRKSELCRFKVSDFSEDSLVCDGALYKSSPILTKGNKMLECYTLAKKFKPHLDRWMALRSELKIESEWLFPAHGNQSSKPGHLSIGTLNSWAMSLSNMTGRDFYFHALRHYYCTALIKAGIPDSVIVDIVGWSSSEMLKIYNDNPKDEQIARYFRNGDISVPQQTSLLDL